MQQHLGVTINPSVKLVVRIRRIIQRDVVRNNEPRLSHSGDDQVAQVAVVRLDIALAGT